MPNDIETRILKALKDNEKPMGCKEIGEKIGEKTQTVMAKLRVLKKNSLVESVGNGKYKITEEGLKNIE